MRTICAVLVLGLSGCGGAQRPSAGATSQAGSLVGDGPRCQGGACTCRDLDVVGRGERVEEEGVVKGRKRIELRSGYGLDPIEWTLDGRGTARKSTESPDPLCSYVDLAPGKYRLKVRARAADARAGFHPTLAISEHGPAAKDWYDTFRFKCGGTEPCSEPAMHAWQEEVRKVARGVHDPCGSVRVRELGWSSDRSSGEKLEEIELSMTLEIYPFPTRFPRGSPRCGERAPRTDEEVGEAAGSGP